MIEGLRTLGKTILLTTHYLEEAERLADRIAVIVAGRIVAEGPPATLGERDRRHARITFTPPAGIPLDELPVPPDVLTAEPLRVLHDLSAWALERGVDLPDLEVRRPSLEDVYLELTKAAS
jgi:ABC-2 type transport system ATP-binding protein